MSTSKGLGKRLHALKLLKISLSNEPSEVYLKELQETATVVLGKVDLEVLLSDLTVHLPGVRIKLDLSSASEVDIERIRSLIRRRQ